MFAIVESIIVERFFLYQIYLHHCWDLNDTLSLTSKDVVCDKSVFTSSSLQTYESLQRTEFKAVNVKQSHARRDIKPFDFNIKSHTCISINILVYSNMLNLKVLQ